jgi:hypothetical protein
MDMNDVLSGTDEGGWDRAANDEAAKFLAAVRQHQEAVWAVVAQGRVVVRVGRNDYNGEEWIYPMRCWLYLPDRFRSWWDQNNQDCMQAIAGRHRNGMGTPQRLVVGGL